MVFQYSLLLLNGSNAVAYGEEKGVTPALDMFSHVISGRA